MCDAHVKAPMRRARQGSHVRRQATQTSWLPCTQTSNAHVMAPMRADKRRLTEKVPAKPQRARGRLPIDHSPRPAYQVQHLQHVAALRICARTRASSFYALQNSQHALMAHVPAVLCACTVISSSMGFILGTPARALQGPSRWLHWLNRRQGLNARLMGITRLERKAHGDHKVWVDRQPGR